MGKHSEEKKKKNNSLLIVFLCILIVTLCFFLSEIFKQYGNNQIKENESKYKIDSKTIEGKKLVIKGKEDYARYIEFIFENNILIKENIYEQFDDKYQYRIKKDNYESQDVFELLKSNDKKLILEVEKKDLGTDTGLTYGEIYDKYLVQIIGAYEVIE